MRIKIRDKCNLTGMKPEINVALWVINPILEEYSKYVNCWWLWSVTDGKHGRKSLHYPGMAVDISQTWKKSVELNTKANVGINLQLEMRKALGARYDVLWHNNHIHIEYQPK